MYGFPKSKTQRPTNFKAHMRATLLHAYCEAAAESGEVLPYVAYDIEEMQGRANALCAETDRLLGIPPHERAFLNYQASARKVVQALDRMDRRGRRR